MITPKIGNHYVIHHSSGNITARFLRMSVYNPTFNHNRIRQMRSTTHYIFQNLSTGREIIIKSRAKIRKEVTFESAEHLPENTVDKMRLGWKP